MTAFEHSQNKKSARFRLPGGRVVWEDAYYLSSCNKVQLQRVVHFQDRKTGERRGTVRTSNVDPDTIIEILE